MCGEFLVLAIHGKECNEVLVVGNVSFMGDYIGMNAWDPLL